MITICGFVLSITLRIMSRFVSHKRASESLNSPILSARRRICCRDSSPEMYSSLILSAQSSRQSCSNSVDLPMPGSPPTSTIDPLTMPPPSTRSNSAICVVCRSSLTVEISLIVFGVSSEAAFLVFCDCLEVLSTISSTKVFHSPHAGHCPAHLADSCPQFWQKNTVFCFAIILFKPSLL